MNRYTPIYDLDFTLESYLYIILQKKLLFELLYRRGQLSADTVAGFINFFSDRYEYICTSFGETKTSRLIHLKEIGFCSYTYYKT